MAKRFISWLIIGLVFFLTKPAYSLTDVDEAESYRKLFVTTVYVVGEYEKSLGIYANPFAYVYGINEANSVYQSLLNKNKEAGFDCENSFFAQIKLELIKNSNHPDLELIENFLLEAQTALNNHNPNKRSEKQSHLLGLKMLLPILSRFEEKQYNEPGQEQKEEKKKDEEKPEWPPEANDSYKPHTKDLGDKNNSKKTVIAEVNFKTPVFGEIIYDTVIRRHHFSFQATDLPWLVEKSIIAKTMPTTEYMKIYPLGKRDIKLFMPTGYMPGTPDDADATIQPAAKGGYRLSLAKDFKELSIPLHKAPSSHLNDYLKGIYTGKVGISIDELPEKIQIAIINRFDPGVNHNAKAEELAKAIAAHIARDYLYSSKARPEEDPIAALQAGAFQCDMAAYIMVAILRDIYNIPSRAVAGFRAKKANNSSKTYSYLLTPETGHAWVEVFIDGTWRYFDPTPIKKDKEDGKDKENQDFSDWHEGDQNKPLEAEVEQDPNHFKAQVNQNTTNETQLEKPIDESKDNKTEPFFFPELEQNLQNLLLANEPETNPLKKKALQDILIYILNPLLSAETIQSKINIYQSIFDHTQELKNILFASKEVHKKSHPALAKWLESIYNKIFNQEINDTYKDLLRAKKTIQIYREVSDRADIKLTSLEIEKLLGDILNILEKMNDPIATDIALVDDFKSSAPPILWQSIKDKSGLNFVGNNIPTQILAKDIRDGKLNAEKLINSLYEHTNFILNSSAKPGKMAVKTWQHESLTRGADILPLDRFSDWRHSLLKRPDLDIVGNMKQGTAYHLTNRKKIFTESKKQQNEAERITIVGFDTSGSMAGGLDQFQAALITAFACRALGDVTPTGKHRHKIVLVPFDHEVGKPISVNNTNDALGLIKNYRYWLRNTGGGTDIEKFLIQAMALIAEAQTNSKSPLDIANIILISDGDSSVDYKKVREARNAIHRDTPIQTMFVALGDSTNEDLKKLAQESAKMGMSPQELYRRFSSNDISKFINDSNQNDLEKYKSAFYSLKKPGDIPPNDRNEIIKIFKRIIAKTEQLNQQTISRITPTKKPEDHKKELDFRANGIGTNKRKHEERKIEAWLLEFREWIQKYGMQKDAKLLEMILDGSMVNFEKLLGVKFGDLSYYESEQLKHLLQTGN